MHLQLILGGGCPAEWDNLQEFKKADFHLPQHADIAFDNTSSFLQKLTETNPTAVIINVTEPRPHPPTPRPFKPIAFTSLYNPEYTNHAEVATKCCEIL